MATQPEEIDTIDEEEIVEEEAAEETQDDTAPDPDDEGDDDKANDEGDGGEDRETLTVQIGDEEPEQAEDDDAGAPEWVKQLRRENREMKKKLREQQKADDTGLPELGEKPTLASCDYDEDEYATKLDAWHADKLKHEAVKKDREQLVEKQNASWQKRLAYYDERKAALGARDFEDVEDNAREMLQQGFPGIQQIEDMRLNMIKQAADDPALVVYALGKNPKRARELAEIDDPVKFAAAIGRMEASVKTTRKPKVAPEGGVGGGKGTGAGSADNHLERLRAEAAKTGDFSKVTAYKRKLKKS